LIKVEGVSKKFCRDLKKSLWYGMKDLGSEILGRPHGGEGELRSDEFWAVKDVSFELKRGECLGLIGRNGAGKTTLLRMLNGLLKPDRGRIEMRGRLGALIALGAGFNPILTGRENIYVNAAILGLGKRNVDSKLEEIIDFSELGEFIDMPVQSYSSGMNVRLGFSIAAILIQPDILFLDEVLAVGDIGFTIKCLNAVRGLSQQSAVVFVSHNMQYISAFCTRVMVLDRGQILLDATNSADGIDRYYSLMEHHLKISGTGEAEIVSIDFILDDGGCRKTESPSDSCFIISQGVSATARLKFDVLRENSMVAINLVVVDASMTPIIAVPVYSSNGEAAALAGPHIEIDIPLGKIELNSGQYSITINITDISTREVLLKAQGLMPFRVRSSRTDWARIIRPALFN
jgi:lipopolysaccharide transport system ATP-binding protein